MGTRRPSFARASLAFALAGLLLVPAAARGAVLFDSTPSPPGLSAASQDFEASLNVNDALVADDFTVPPGQTWTIQRAFIDGKMALPPGPGTTDLVNVSIFANSGTLPVAAPFYSMQLTADPATAFPDFTLNLPGLQALTAGTYWLGAQARLDFEAGVIDNLWLWGSIVAPAKGNPAAYRNPGDGFGTGCTSFGVLTDCVDSVANPDVAFRLEGTCVGCPVAAVDPPATPAKKCKKGQKLKKGKCVKKKKKKKKKK